MMIALRTGISATTLSAVANATTTSITAGVSGGRGTYTYLWSQSGTSCTITSLTSASTTFTGSGVAGTTTVFCNIRDTITGNTLNTSSCIITWTAVPVNQNVVISGTVTFNGGPQAYTLTGTPASPVPTGTPSTFTNAGTYTYPSNITSITPGSGYTLGTVSGSFVINRATISGTPANTSVTFNGSQQSATVITGVTPVGATFTGSVTASGTNAGSYTSSITGSGNYQGTVNGGTLTINSASITAMSFTLNGVSFTTPQSRTAGTSYTIAVGSVTPSVATYSPTSTVVSAAGSYSLTSSGTGNYQGSFISPLLTLTDPPQPLSVGNMISGQGGLNNTGNASTSGTVSGGTAPYSISWARVSGVVCILIGSSGSPTSTATWRTNATSGTLSTVRMSVTDALGATASNTTTIGWSIA